MDIRQLKYFIAVAEAKNLSRAAKSLFITQPTLSQTIKKIESELNTTLFTQNHKQFELTKAGELLYNKGKDIVQDFDALINEIQSFDKEKSERLIVGQTVLFSIQFMKEISEFINTHPNVELKIVQDGSRKLQELLASGQIDIGLISFPKCNDDIVIEPLHTSTKGYQVSVVMPDTHPLANRQSIGFKELANESFSALSDHFMLGKIISERSSHFGFNPKIVFIHNDWEVLVHSVLNLNSICLLPSELQSISSTEHVAWIPLVDKNNYYPIGIGLRKNTTCTQTMNDFITTIKKN
ncbi:transcriptional regulator, LysR family [Granulicatella balaenopterae]|uniref:Transcriptional regulator, LysR family n=1 Tax=Granulicatella balaenopterae TaxID=137733 RepID=A0A1H9HDZ1_9LACT|nr:LysR family transcriptional regulator [Granulicatella balaenopterae]SEQ60514.1 transcriptional regulator, LysR family [Granulicatella balaenopterae]